MILLTLLLATTAQTTTANYHFNNYAAMEQEVEQALGRCEKTWNSIDTVSTQTFSPDFEQQTYDQVLDEVVKLVRAMSEINTRIRRHELQLSLEVLSHLHEIIEQMRFEVHNYSQQSNSFLTRNDYLIPLLFDLLDRDFAHVYYHYEQ